MDKDFNEIQPTETDVITNINANNYSGKAKLSREEFYAKKAQRKKKIRRRAITAIMVSFVLGSLVGGKIVGNYKDKQIENLKEYYQNREDVNSFFADIVAEGSYSAEDTMRLLRPISDTPMETFDIDVKYKDKILFAKYYGIPVERAGFISYDPHYEKTDGEWSAKVLYTAEDGVTREIAHTNSLDKLGREIVLIGVDASHVDHTLTGEDEEKCKMSYTNRFADVIDQYYEKQEQAGQGQFGM